MSDYEKIFSEGDNQQGTQGQGDNQAPTVIINGKAWTVDEIAKKFEHADNHIETILKEKAEMESQLQSAAKLEDALAALKSKDESGTEPTSHVDPDQLKSQVLEALKQEEQLKAAEANLNKSKEIVKSFFGEDYATKVAQVAEENGLTPSNLEDLMKTSPKAVEKLIGVTSGTGAAPSAGSVNSAGVLKNAEQTASASAYEEAKALFRKTNNSRYFNEMTKLKFQQLNKT